MNIKLKESKTIIKEKRFHIITEKNKFRKIYIKDKQGNLVGNKEQILGRRRKYFFDILNEDCEEYPKESITTIQDDHAEDPT